MLTHYTTFVIGQVTKLEIDQGNTGLTLKCYVIELIITSRNKELDLIIVVQKWRAVQVCITSKI